MVNGVPDGDFSLLAQGNAQVTTRSLVAVVDTPQTSVAEGHVDGSHKKNN